MIQNTLAEIAVAVIRDWRMYWASACMIGLVQVLDDAIIHAVDMNGDLRDRPGRASVEARDRNRADTVVAGPGQRVHDVGRTTG